MKKLSAALAGVVLGLALNLHAAALLSAQPVETSGGDDLSAAIEVVTQTAPTPADEVPAIGEFHSAAHPDWPPLPGNFGYPAWNLGGSVWLLDDLTTDSTSISATKSMTLMSDADLNPGDGGTNDESGYTNNFVPFPLDTNSLYLGIQNCDGNLAYLNIHNATNFCYSIWSKMNLPDNWQVESELFPTNGTDQTNCLPFTVATLGRTNLFLRAEDWTGIDSDGDGVPDWWSWLYWATNNLPDTNLDYSGSSYTFAQDYSNNIVPTVFSFTGLEVTNNYVNTMSAPVQLDVAGNPYYMAVSVDDTSFQTDAFWQPYSGSNVMVNLGLTEGWHDVWIGLRGHVDDPSAAVWQWRRLKLDYTPPALVITGPTNSTVNVPLIQLTGYSPEALGSISYDLSNAAGTVTNQPVLVEGQDYSTNTAEFTTNYFQAYDVPLTNGVNTLTLHATDLAGNLTTTNLSITLDYSAKTNPPTVQLLWPQDGMEIVGSNIVCRGWVSDDTATVTVQLVDAGGNTNTVNSLVGRDGNFYSGNLNLAEGTNYLTYTVTDAAGNIATTNIAVSASDLGLTLDTVVAGQAEVSGRIDDESDTVYVNGVEATNDGDGNWNATITPIGVGGGAVVVQAMTTNNGGNSNAPALQQMVAAPQGVYVSARHSTYDYQMNDPEMILDHENPSYHGSFDWEDGQGGNQSAFGNFEDYVYYPDSSGIIWPATRWPQDLPAGVQTFIAVNDDPSQYDPAQTNTTIGGVGTPVLPLNHQDTYTSGYTSDYLGHYTDRETGDTEMKLATGGPPGSRQMNLWCISATATDAETGQPIAFTNISIGSFGNLDEDGNLWVMLPDNDPPNVTPKAKWNKNYTFSVNIAEYNMRVVANDMTLSDKYVWPGRDFCVGEGIYFNVVGLPPFKEAIATWTLPGNFVNRQPDENCLAYYDQDTSLLTRSSVTNGGLTTYAWYVNEALGNNASVTVKYRFVKNGPWSTYTISGKFNVHRPQIISTSQPDGTPTPMISPDQTLLELGDGRDRDMSFEHQINPGLFSGHAGYTQIVGDSGDHIHTYKLDQSIDRYPSNQLDNGEFQRGVKPISAYDPLFPDQGWTDPFYDGPQVNVAGNGTESSEILHFHTYLLFMPDAGPGPNIYVPLRKIDWLLNDRANATTLDPYSTTGVTSDTDWSSFPHWTGTIFNE